MIEAIGSQVKRRVIWATTALIDAAFLAIWVAAQWGLSYVEQTLALSNWLDQAVLTIARYVFAVSTLMPIVLFLGRDLWIMCITVWKEMMQAYGRDDVAQIAQDAVD
jgi:hypothetical protein